MNDSNSNNTGTGEETVRSQSPVKPIPEKPLDLGVETSPEKPLDFGTEPKADDKAYAYNKQLSDRDIFDLGKKILFSILVLFICVSVVHMIFDKYEGVKEVWEFSKVFLSSVVTLILGYYFGDKKKQ